MLIRYSTNCGDSTEFIDNRCRVIMEGVAYKNE